MRLHRHQWNCEKHGTSICVLFSVPYAFMRSTQGKTRVLKCTKNLTCKFLFQDSPVMSIHGHCRHLTHISSVCVCVCVCMCVCETVFVVCVVLCVCMCV